MADFLEVIIEPIGRARQGKDRGVMMMIDREIDHDQIAFKQKV